MRVEMEIREIQMKEDLRESQIVVLGEKDGKRVFPIFVGFFEAQAMYVAVHAQPLARPMTHDLIANVIDGLDARLAGICIDDLREATFHGKLILETKDGKQILVDSRPSDALVMAVKRQAPIYVESHVLDEVDANHQNGEGGENEV